MRARLLHLEEQTQIDEARVTRRGLEEELAAMCVRLSHHEHALSKVSCIAATHTEFCEIGRQFPCRPRCFSRPRRAHFVVG